MMRLRLAVSSRRGGNVYIREGGRERKREREREREREMWGRESDGCFLGDAFLQAIEEEVLIARSHGVT